VDGRGAAEGVRLLLAAGNAWDRVLDRRWPIDMTKVRDGIAVACPLFDQAIKDGELRMNMNRIPVLIHTDPETGVVRQVGQSSAMERYVKGEDGREEGGRRGRGGGGERYGPGKDTVIIDTGRSAGRDTRWREAIPRRRRDTKRERDGGETT
jgi:hypothetical protein